jgi:hypothetical protein
MTGRECLIDLDVIARQLSRATGTDGGMCWADIHSCLPRAGIVRRFGSSIGSGCGRPGLIFDRLLMRAATYPKFGRICEGSALSPVAGACRWSLPLPSAEGSVRTAPGLDGS